MRCRIRPTPAAHRAFTLIELATVVIVLSVLAAMAAPRFGSFLANQRLEAATRRITIDLALAQRDARRTGTSRNITFNAVGDRYKLWGFNSMDNPNKDYIVMLGDEPYSVDLVSASLGGDMNLQYDAYGVPDSDGIIIIQAGSLQRTINVNGGTGRAVSLPTVTTAPF